MAKSTISAADIVSLLEQRHAADLTVAECKNGPTQMRPDGVVN